MTEETVSKRPGRGAPVPSSLFDLRQALDDIAEAYEDVDSPRRRFALTKLRQGPPEKLLFNLRSIAELRDDTDINWDTSFRFIIGSESLLIVQLSMVGPYALICREEEDPLDQTITSKKDCCSRTEELVFQAVIDQKWILLPSNLNQVVKLKLAGANAVSVYQALFQPENGES